jgi:hypothetical protein
MTGRVYLAVKANPLTAVGLLAAVVALAGCGDAHIDSAKVQRQMRANLTPAPSAVACPPGLHAKGGTTFICRLRYPDGDTGELAVHELDGAGHVEAGPGDLTILTIGRQHAQTVLRQLVTKNHVGLRTSACPANAPAEAGTLTCRVIDINGLHATVTEHIAPGGALTINPATDLHVQLPKAKPPHH